MFLERVKSGDNIGVSDENISKSTRLVENYEETCNRELKMLMELWKSGSKDEQHRLAQALLELDI